MTICKSCGGDIPEGGSVCPKCGMAADIGYDHRTGREPWFMGWDWGAPGYWGDWIKRWSWIWSPAWIMVNMVMLGLFIVYSGLILLVAASGFSQWVTWGNFWGYLLSGIGFLMVIRWYARLLIAGRRLWYSDLVGGLILIIIGVAGILMSMAGMGRYSWVLLFVLIGLGIIGAGIVNYHFMKKMRGIKKDR